MKLKIIAVGKNKQKYLNEGISQYQKQISDLTIIEVLDGKTSSDVKKEGQDILAKIGADEYVIALAILGEQYSSEEFSKQLEAIATYQSNKITFVIGGSYGLSDEVYQRANQQISFSKMTFPHLLMRLILVEQIYRAVMIMKNHPYHK